MARSASSDSLSATATRLYSGDVAPASTSPKRRYACASVRALPAGTALPVVDPGIRTILAIKPGLAGDAGHPSRASKAMTVPAGPRRALLRTFSQGVGRSLGV